MKTLVSSAILVFIALSSSYATADIESEQKAALRLMEVSGTKSAMETMSGQMLGLQIQQNPMLAPYRQILADWNNTYLSYDSIKVQLAEIYLDYFSEDELNQLIEFYSTELGQKSVSVTPDIMVLSSELGAAVATEYAPKLERMIMAESQRIQLLQSAE